MNTPTQIGIADYQLAKLRMLEFYHHFILKYLKLDKYQLVFSNTDSFFISIIKV